MTLVDLIATNSATSLAIADGICLLATRAMQLGETEDVDYRVGGEVRTARRPRPELFHRLENAAASGVFERRDAEAIVDHILMTPAPSAERVVAAIEGGE